MASSQVAEIKNRLDIVELIGSYIKLQKAGANFRALCPFHSEKSPSFFVSPSRQIWHCFGGCGQGGDIFKFIMLIEGVEFGDALRQLAQKAGVVLKRESPELRTQRQRLYEICELATLFFEKQLEEQRSGKLAKEYLLRRGINEESVKKWRIGWSPEVWQGLSDFLVSKGFSRAEIEKAGLSVKSDKGSFYDRFRGRIVFPVFDLSSQVVGFGGRVFASSAEALAKAEKEQVAKYVNIPNTLLYDKSRILYGLDKAKQDIRQKQECILVEGYTDAILVSQAGFPNVVAVSGTALTPFHLNILKRYSENLLTAFDMDFAGDSATKRGVDLAQEMGFNIKVLLLSEGSDPADIVAQDAGLFSKLLQEARSILEFYFETTFSRFNPALPENKTAISKLLLPVIKRIPNSIERSFWVRELARRLEVREDDVLEELKKVGPKKYDRVPENQETTVVHQKSRRELLEEQLLALAFKFPECLKSLDQEAQVVLADLKHRVEAQQEYFNYIYLKAEVEELQKKDALPEIQFCLKEIKCLDIKNELGQISREIKKAEQERNIQKTAELTKKFDRISKTMIQLT
ncbi:MAG: DNA primase [Parcubacteria group bacterium Gr01-1014_30]|nr:MAG: DNA primase [Parcubacteria group bacterium Gr01-1014_30]